MSYPCPGSSPLRSKKGVLRSQRKKKKEKETLLIQLLREMGKWKMDFSHTLKSSYTWVLMGLIQQCTVRPEIPVEVHHQSLHCMLFETYQMSDSIWCNLIKDQAFLMAQRTMKIINIY